MEEKKERGRIGWSGARRRERGVGGGSPQARRLVPADPDTGHPRGTRRGRSLPPWSPSCAFCPRRRTRTAGQPSAGAQAGCLGAGRWKAAAVGQFCPLHSSAARTPPPPRASSSPGLPGLGSRSPRIVPLLQGPPHRRRCIRQAASARRPELRVAWGKFKAIGGPCTV